MSSYLTSIKDLHLYEAVVATQISRLSRDHPGYFSFNPLHRANLSLQGITEMFPKDAILKHYDNLFQREYYERLFSVIADGSDEQYDENMIEDDEFRHYLLVLVGLEDVEASVMGFFQKKFKNEE